MGKGELCFLVRAEYCLVSESIFMAIFLFLQKISRKRWMVVSMNLFRTWSPMLDGHTITFLHLHERTNCTGLQERMVGYKHRLEEWKDDGPGMKHKLELMTKPEYKREDGSPGSGSSGSIVYILQYVFSLSITYLSSLHPRVCFRSIIYSKSLYRLNLDHSLSSHYTMCVCLKHILEGIKKRWSWDIQNRGVADVMIQIQIFRLEHYPKTE
jgi:hypothetical protein